MLDQIDEYLEEYKEELKSVAQDQIDAALVGMVSQEKMCARLIKGIGEASIRAENKGVVSECCRK